MSRKKNILHNREGFPYVPAQLVEANWRWYIEFWVFDHDSGLLKRKRRFNIQGSTKSQKRQNATSQIEEINRLLHSGYSLGNKPDQVRIPTVKEAFTKAIQIKHAEVGKRGQQAYRSFGNLLFEWADREKVSAKFITKFTKQDCYGFLDWLLQEKKYANKSRNNIHIFLNASLNLLVERGFISKNPAKGIPKLKTVSTRHLAYNEEQKRILENYLKSEHPDLYNFTRFVYFGFLRPVEICRLKIRHIDKRQKIILVRSNLSKNKQQLPVVINPQWWKIIEGMKLEQYPDSYFIFSKGLKPGPKELIRNRVSEMHSLALQATDLNNGELDLYSWKHTGNCNAYLAGVGIKALQEQNRHSSLEMTEKYLRALGLRITKELKSKEW